MKRVLVGLLMVFVLLGTVVPSVTGQQVLTPESVEQHVAQASQFLEDNPFEVVTQLSSEGKLSTTVRFLGERSPQEQAVLLVNESGSKTLVFEEGLKGKSKEWVINSLEPDVTYSFNLRVEARGGKEQQARTAYYGSFVIRMKDGGEGFVHAPRATLLEVSEQNLAGGDGEVGISNTVYFEQESNNTFASANMIFDGEHVYGTIHNSSDLDYFRIQFNNSGKANVYLGNIPSGRDYDLYVYDENQNLINWSTNGSNSDEFVTLHNVVAGKNYYLRVHGWNGSSHSSAYYVLKVHSYASHELPDSYEPNNSLSTATYIGKGTYYANLHHPSDNDYYSFYVPRTSSVNLTLSDIPAGNDYDIVLYDGNYNVVDWGMNWDNQPEHISTTIEPGSYFIRVYSYSGSSNNHYRLTLSTEDIPVILVPGIGGTVLRTWDNYNGGESLSWLRFTYQNTHMMERLLLNNSSGTVQPNNPRYSVIVPQGNHGLDAISVIAPDAFLFGLDKYYHDLIRDLENRGYVAGQTLFGFPYDFRQDNLTHASLMKARVDLALQQSGADKVIIVSHSMGGLVTKQFLQSYPSYEGNVDKWITLGTPHTGAGKAIQAFINGYNFDIPWVERNSGLHLAMHAPSVYQLLPSDYYFTQYSTLPALSYVHHGVRQEANSRSALISALGSVHTSGYLTFQHNLASLAQQRHASWDQNFSNIRMYQVVGTGVETPVGIQYNTNVSSLSQLASQSPSPIIVSGDGTVPALSAAAFGTNNMVTYYANGVGHNDLVKNSSARALILNLINGIETVGGASVSHSAAADLLSSTALSFPFETEAYSVAAHTPDGEEVEVLLLPNGTFTVLKETKGVNVSIFGDRVWMFFPADKEIDVQTVGQVEKDITIYEIKDSQYKNLYTVRGNQGKGQQGEGKAFRVFHSQVESNDVQIEKLELSK